MEFIKISFIMMFVQYLVNIRTLKSIVVFLLQLDGLDVLPYHDQPHEVLVHRQRGLFDR